ncbi:hypothetical protein MACH24_09400 [Erythrobacter sp. Dej080120_24]|uniref:DUF1838 family protein n=1 Tax=Erythrobacter sp. Dej080120_24 TaxID=3024837 RepID=UPI002924CB4F|nr:hypothetical protein MACH24_09400 [Erythrobacter sp. Dej080120_24]
MHRRQFLSAGAACTSTALLACAGAGAGASPASARPVSRFGAESGLVGDYLDLTTPRGNRQAQARIMGNIDMESTKFGWFKGVVHGVRPGEKVRDLFGFSGFSATRLLPHDDPEEPGYKKILREVGFYTDLETGEVIESWYNPYLDETVRVVPIANDPFNHLITDYMIAPPNYGGLNNDMPVRVPKQLEWERMGNLLMISARINLFYPAALQPEKWPRESGGRMNQVSEMFLYQMNWDDMQNPALTSVEATGGWVRITPWLPWMLMGPSEGHCAYTCFFGATNTLDGVDPFVIEYAKQHYPKYLEAPEQWEEPSLSSLEWYAREQQPAPLPADGTIPTAPLPPRPR